MRLRPLKGRTLSCCGSRRFVSSLLAAGAFLTLTTAPGQAGPPAALEDPVAGMFAAAVELESRGQLLAAAERFERDAARSDAAVPCWRAARAYFRHAEIEASRGPTPWPLFERAESLARLGLDRDPSCGACAVWRYAAMGRLVELHGYTWGARHAKQMRRLLDLGFEERPRHRDPDGNSTLANLYFFSASFYRMLPPAFFTRWLVGARGDLDRAVHDIRRALEISSDRVDYRVEYGAVLLCQGHRGKDASRIDEGRQVLRSAVELPVRRPMDPVDQERALVLLSEDPGRACGSSPTGFQDLESAGRGAVAAR